MISPQTCFYSTSIKVLNDLHNALKNFSGSFILALTGIAANHVGRYFGPISSVHGAIAGGLGVALGIFASAGASGGHINPAVTMGHLVLGRMGDGVLSNIWARGDRYFKNNYLLKNDIRPLNNGCVKTFSQLFY